MKPCSWEDRLVLFTRFLVNNKLKSATVKSYLSAIRSVLAELGEKLDVNNYQLKSLTKACRLRNDVIIHHLPISKEVLRLILNGINSMFADQCYLNALHKAVISSAYYGLLRIGEIAMGPHCVLARNVHVGVNKNKILFILLSSKTHT